MNSIRPRLVVALFAVAALGALCPQPKDDSKDIRPRQLVMDLSHVGDGNSPPYIAFVAESAESISAGHRDSVKFVNLDDRAHRIAFSSAGGAVSQWLYTKGATRPNEYVWVGVSKGDVGKNIPYSCDLAGHTGETGSFYVGN